MFYTKLPLPDRPIVTKLQRHAGAACALPRSSSNRETQATRQIFDSIMLIMRTYGIFSEIYYKGKMSEKIAQ